MQTATNPSADQVNAFFGANGVESLYGGTRGRVTLIRGILTGDTYADLVAALDLFESYDDGQARVLVTTIGRVFSYVKYGIFEPGEVKNTLDIGYVEYRASFNHLT